MRDGGFAHHGPPLFANAPTGTQSCPLVQCYLTWGEIAWYPYLRDCRHFAMVVKDGVIAAATGNLQRLEEKK